MQWRDGEPLPKWVAVDLDGYRARLARHSDAFRAVVGPLGIAGVVVALLVLGILGLIALIGTSMGALWLPTVVTLAFILLTCFGLVRLYRDHVVKVTEHTFRWNDLRGRFWELPLGAFSGADVQGRTLVLYRHRNDPLRLRAAGVSPPQLAVFAATLEALIQSAQQIEAPPEELERLRRGQAAEAVRQQS